LHLRSGNLQQTDTKAWIGRAPSLPLELMPGQQVGIRLRVQSESSISVPLLLFDSPFSYSRSSLRSDALDLLFIGMALTTFLIAAFFFGLFRSRLYIFHALMVLAFLVYYMLFNGYYHMLHLPNIGFAVRHMLLFASQAVIYFLFLFLMVFYKGEADPRLRSLIWRTGNLSMLVMLILLLLVDYPLAITLQTSLVLCLFGGYYFLSAYHALRYRDFTSRWLFISVVCCSAAVALIYLQFYASLPQILTPANAQRLMFFCFSVLFFVAIQDRLLYRQQSALAQSDAEAKLSDARLSALRYQLNPHFLFNALNSIIYLVKTQPEEAPTFVRKLADFLRTTLRPNAHHMTMFAAELGAIRAYLDIERVRFGDQLQVNVDIADGLEECMVPELLLQPLVENAIKHGSPASEDGPLELRIKAVRCSAGMRVTVSNSGKICNENSATEGHGIGLNNLRERLQLAYAGRASFSLKSADGWVLAELFVPCQLCR
jgi:hypothetical protein